jgi:hypothetical protein
LTAQPNGAGKSTRARVATRVQQGGHDVAEDVIRRRYTAGWYNFQHRYKPLVDTWLLYDNSGKTPNLLDQGEMTPSANPKPIPRQTGVEAALRRADAEALKLGQRTNTPVWVLRHGQIVDLNKTPQEKS